MSRAVGLSRRPVLLSDPLRALAFALGGTSVATLLLYFYGVAEMRWAVLTLLVPAASLLAALVVVDRWRGKTGLSTLVCAGLWAGGMATLAYDLVRVPVAMAGVPVFKAISYFGTVILGRHVPDLASEVAGWSFHLSNGVGFGLMYALLVSRPRWWTAALWGVFLEAAMLATPYAEIFGYRLSGQFLAITLGSHLVYGLVLWAALRAWRLERGAPGSRRAAVLAGAFAVVPLGIGGVAADFHLRHVASVPPSPPPYIGRHLYTTWNALEVDRLATLWLVRRFVDTEARFHFVEPFTHIALGVPIDTPEAEIRRDGTRAATEVLLDRHGLGSDPRLELLGRASHLDEIVPWLGPTDPAALDLARRLRAAVAGCRQPPATGVRHCVDDAFELLDGWYATPLDGSRSPG